MRLILASPFQLPFFDGYLTARKTVRQIFKEMDDLAWAEEFITVRLNGNTVPKPWWPHVTVKPEAAGTLELCLVPQKGNLLPILATVAVIAATTAISFGAAGPLWAAAGLGATASATASSNFGAGHALCVCGIAELFAVNQCPERSA